MEPKSIIETIELTKTYPGSKTAVDRLTMQIKEGEIFGFLGPNGAGKTTTLLMLLGLTEPTAGKAFVLGADPAREPMRVKKVIGYLPENMGFYRDLNAIDSLRFITDLNHVPAKTAEDRIEYALNTVGLLSEARKKVAEYSRGMRQRLGLAEVLVKNPRIAFLDEPTLGLDPDTTHRIVSLIKKLSQENKMTVLLSSHMLNLVQQICDRIGIMIDGKMVAQGPMAQLAQEKLGVGAEEYSLEELYMKYFKEA